MIVHLHVYEFTVNVHMSGVAQILINYWVAIQDIVVGESNCPDDLLTNFLVVPKQNVLVRTRG